MKDINDTPYAAYQKFMEYMVDTGQRSVLYWDVMRQRGNQYLEQMAENIPHVLQFKCDLILDGRKLTPPVNYGIVKIDPPKGTALDDRKRPFVVIDPRAGHGPGIGGFKADSEIGEALRAGHHCYFIGFTPFPEPGQTIDAVIDAWAVFLDHVAHRHPEADGKPVVIGNCQAGWALMMLAAKRPELCGPIIAAGSPVSYWAGVRGANPMRYTGGMLAGSWLSALTSDLGNGMFDGAWLVQNFENLNPANTLWSKQYNLYANIDKEGPRYLGFERWWGGHVVLSGEEIQYIVDNLFVGNKLSTAGIVSADGVRLDLRKIRSPIICLCSKGDNITPPQQALGWIIDLYGSDADILAAGQTIVYSVHETIGHLGIFVSGSVAKKEHQEFASNIDLIDCLPPGLYEAIMQKKKADDAGIGLVIGEYISRFERRSLADIRAMGGNTPEEERCFAAVARLSDVTHGLYRTTAQPMIRTLSSERSAEWLRRMHPLRLSYELCSDRNPAVKPLPEMAQQVKKNRRPVAADNPFLEWEKSFSDWMTFSLDAYRDFRDMMVEQMFFGIYGQSWLQALLGLHASEEPPRVKPGRDADHMVFVKRRIEELRLKMDQGGPREAAIRAVLYIRLAENAADERGFETLRRIRAEQSSRKTLAEFKQDLREQFFMLHLDEKRAVALISELLKKEDHDGRQLFETIRTMVTAGGPLNEEGHKRLAQVEQIFCPPQPAARSRRKTETPA
ncbi:MAG: 3-hydroxyalkanoate synthetase [Desulfatitalea sp. BRH_c12]|nr:MAG: 3-hydroxyalkanoate synthetase [Desulfatitalea sp. BRH_c12]